MQASLSEQVLISNSIFFVAFSKIIFLDLQTISMNTSAIMEQTRYWMWAGRKFNSPISAISTSSWEEQAFAEDSAGLLGGCIWPPRSYTCSFCRREFRSAQALGGHMNVHRRDRARLKQSSSPSDETLDQAGTLDQFYTPNPNPNFAIIGSSVPTASALELNLGVGNWKGKRGWEKDDDVDVDDDVEIMCDNNKRRRIDHAVFPSIIKPPLGELRVIRSEVVLKLSPSDVEEIDLELRLGDPPKVKKNLSTCV